MDSIKRQKIIKEHLLGKSWKAIAAEMGIQNPQSITNDRYRNPKLWAVAERYVLESLIRNCYREISACQKNALKYLSPNGLNKRWEYINRAAEHYSLLGRLLPKLVERETADSEDYPAGEVRGLVI